MMACFTSLWVKIKDWVNDSALVAFLVNQYMGKGFTVLIQKRLNIHQKYRDTSTPQLSITTKSPIKLDFEGGRNSISFVCND